MISNKAVNGDIRIGKKLLTNRIIGLPHIDSNFFYLVHD